MRREELDVELVREAGELAVRELVDTDRFRFERTARKAPELDLRLNEREDAPRLVAVLVIFWVHDPVRAVLLENDGRADDLAVVVIEPGQDQARHVVVLQ